MAFILDRSPKLLPAHRNLAWNIPATLTDERPVLAILELKIRSGLNILEPGTPSNNLLRKALEYCSSLPGTRLHCGKVRDQSSLIILVELPSARAWQDFEASAALDLLVATFESSPTCNCLIWTTPQSFPISGTVELRTFHLGTVAEAFALNRGQQFDQTWAAFTTDIAATGSQSTHGNWVERYCMAIPLFHSPPGRRVAVLAAFDAQPATFMGIVCGDSADGDASQPAIEELIQKTECSVLRRTLVLQPWLEQSQDTYTTNAGTAPPSPLTLFEPVKPVFRRDNGMSLKGEDMTWRSNYYAARREKTPGFPEPRGGYQPLGTINQYSCPTHLGDEPVADASLPVADTLRLTFKAGILDAPDNEAEHLLERFRQFRQDVAALDNCEALHWARKHGDANVVVLFIVWCSRQDQPEDLLAVCSPLLHRYGISSHVDNGPLHQHSFTISTHTLLGLQMAEHLELITFCTADNVEAKRLLQIHAKRYFDTARVLNVVAGRGSAGPCIDFGYAHKRSDSGERAALISMWSWRSAEAREHWYSQFHEIVQRNYERLGHIVDGVRLVATGGIHSEVLDLQYTM